MNNTLSSFDNLNDKKLLNTVGGRHRSGWYYAGYAAGTAANIAFKYLIERYA